MSAAKAPQAAMSLRSSLIRQACDDCKRRKVKCDSARPCSNCRASSLSCQFTTPHRKRGPPKANSPRSIQYSSAISGGQLRYTRPRIGPVSGSGSGSSSGPGPNPLNDTSPPGDTLASVGDRMDSSPRDDESQLSAYSAASAPARFPPDSAATVVSLPSSSSGVASSSLLRHPANDAAGLYAQATRDELLASLRAAVPTEPPEAIVMRCIDLFMRYVFPTTPIVHEAALRRHATTYFADQTFIQSPTQLRGPSCLSLFASDEEHERVARMRQFALVTALCSNISAMMAEPLLAYGHLVAAPFFHAANRMLKTYEEYDVEFPDSSSLSIRALFSGAAQHITGKPGFAVHVYGQAALLALSLRLYNEQALQGRGGPGSAVGMPATTATSPAAAATNPASHRDPVEIQLLRRNFWHIFMSDKSAVSLQTRPALLHEVMFAGGLTLEAHAKPFTPLLDVDQPLYSNGFEERLLVCVDLLFRLWATGCDLIMRIKAEAAEAAAGPMPVATPDGDRASLTAMLAESYLQFVAIVEDLPPWLQVSSLVSPANPAAGYHVEAFQKECFWVQRCTLIMAYHCLRVVIMERCIESDLVAVLGIRDDPFSVAVKKAELIYGFVQALEDIPFVYHQVKGEPSVQRIRIVGTILLEMVQNAEHDIIRSRVAAYFRRLLDVLVKLNSKASEELDI